jgi:hypothetical protein
MCSSPYADTKYTKSTERGRFQGMGTREGLSSEMGWPGWAGTRRPASTALPCGHEEGCRAASHVPWTLKLLVFSETENCTLFSNHLGNQTSSDFFVNFTQARCNYCWQHVKFSDQSIKRSWFERFVKIENNAVRIWQKPENWIISSIWVKLYCYTIFLNSFIVWKQWDTKPQSKPH